MKTKVRLLLITLLFVLCSVSLFALEGMPGLSFGMSADDAVAQLKSLGFTREMGEIGFLFSQAGSTIRLYFSPDEDELVSWLVVISMEDENIDLFEEEIIELLADLHGYELDYDAEYRETWWKIDLYHFLNAGFDEGENNYLIFYGDIRYEDIIPY
ncbi:MAG: hypothetical protein LHW60_04790 [Candidatus Cloacimonetes bacterium]|nr:hypothetical protein [Candidatus Cloacimonadota bacterium]